MSSWSFVSVCFLAALVARPPVHPDVLEPSVQNEVDHALASVSWPPATTNALVLAARADFAKLQATNGLSATARAIALVSTQKGGRWLWNGYDVTPIAAAWLKRLAGEDGTGPEPQAGQVARPIKN